MKSIVTDACIFIDLIELRLMPEFFSIPVEVNTSIDVYNELNRTQQDLLKAYQASGRLNIHNLTSGDKGLIESIYFPRSFSEIDKSVIYLSEKLNASVLSSDKAVRNFAGSKSIEYHGILWVFDKLTELELLSPADAVKKIRQLVSLNIYYLNNSSLMHEINRRITKWGKGL